MRTLLFSYLWNHNDDRILKYTHPWMSTYVHFKDSWTLGIHSDAIKYLTEILKHIIDYNVWVWENEARQLIEKQRMHLSADSQMDKCWLRFILFYFLSNNSTSLWNLQTSSKTWPRFNALHKSLLYELITQWFN